MNYLNPDFNNILNAVLRRPHPRIPLYEHIIDPSIMEKVLDSEFTVLYEGDQKERMQYFSEYCHFFKEMGYDTVSFECLITSVMPNSGALYFHRPPAIKNRKDFDGYPWDDIPDMFFDKYSDDYIMLGKAMPPGMQGIGGPGNGVFECIQDVVGLSNLCLIASDDEELYRQLFFRMGEVFYNIWTRFLERFSDIYTVCRFGDDLGYKSSTILRPEEIRTLLVPQYKKIIDLVHSYKKPFLFHCCGNIFSIMDDLIDTAGIDGKHSNEDEIAPFSAWLEKYSSRIALFGGADMSLICSSKEDEVRKYVQEVMEYSHDYPGFAFGTGNSVPDYMPVENYLAMVEAAREFRKRMEK
jgi:uroporphyrinogen decarboxylase